VEAQVEPTDQLGTMREVLRRPTQSQRLIEERLRRFDELPFLTDGLIGSHLQLVPGDPEPDRLDPPLVRKSSPGGVLLSTPYHEGHVVYFNIFQRSVEIQLERQSDHFVGLPLLEAVRQVGMAMCHLVTDIPIDTRMSLQDFSLAFFGYVEPDYPIVVRSITNLSYEDDLGRDVTAFLDVRQNGVTCMAGTSSGRLFTTEDRYQRVRGKTVALHERYAEAFSESVRGHPARAVTSEQATT
jgi:2-oxo-3-(phosphooxy)propyl 3-oxoalkanoate synthase